ncbi:MAG: RNA-binding cell elongation regulator Jag/EloR [Candidatus Binatia bacterium]
MMDPVEAEGSSIDDAIENALKMLGVTRDRVEIEILSNSARGLFGIGGRKARVRAALRAPIDAESLLRQDEEPVPAGQQEETVSTRPLKQDGTAAEQAAQVLRGILRLMDVLADVSLREEDDQIVLEIGGDSSGVLIGRRGQMLDALEYFLNRVVAREGGATRVVVDSQNYRTRRRQSLEELARRMGEQAKKRRKTVALNPMSPRDRRIVHMVLQADPSLSTRSSGKGYFRKLIIIPAGQSSSGRERSQATGAKEG